MNKAILIGHVGKDPEVRYLDNGTPVANFSLATTKRYKNKNGERVSETSWHNIVLWRKLAEIAEKYIRKGAFLSIEGEITYRSYEDRDKVKRFTTEIICTDLEMLGKKEEGNSEPAESAGSFEEKVNKGRELAPRQHSELTPVENEEKDDLPF